MPRVTTLTSHVTSRHLISKSRHVTYFSIVDESRHVTSFKLKIRVTSRHVILKNARVTSRHHKKNSSHVTSSPYVTQVTNITSHVTSFKFNASEKWLRFERKHQIYGYERTSCFWMRPCHDYASLWHGVTFLLTLYYWNVSFHYTILNFVLRAGA